MDNQDFLVWRLIELDTPTTAREVPMKIKRWNGFSAAEPSESTCYGPNCDRKRPGFWLSAVVKTGSIVNLRGATMEMEIEKLSICANVAELGLH